MIRISLQQPVKLQDFTSIVSKNIINPECRGERREGPANTKPFFQKSILHISFDRSVGIRIRNVIQVATKDYGIRGILYFIFNNTCLDTSVYDTSFEF